MTQPRTDGRPVVEYRASTSFAGCSALGSLVFGAIGIVMVLGPTSDASTRFLGLFATAFFGLGTAVCVRRLARPAKCLRFDEEGLHTDAIPGAGWITVPWRDVADARFWEMGGQRCVVFELRDPEGLIERVPPAGRLLMRANLATCGAPIYASPRVFGVEAEALMEEVRRRLPARRT